MAAQEQHTGTTARKPRSDIGALRLSQRDIDGLLLCGEHFGAPLDLLGGALGVSRGAMNKILFRWKNVGYAASGRLGPGPIWCWLTRDGMAATGLGFTALCPPLGRLAHIRAVLAARLWLEASPAWQQGRAWWHSERRLRAGRPAVGRSDHVPDAEIHWPSVDGSRYAGQVWAIEVELTPKPLGRTIRIMNEMLSPLRYTQVVYLIAPAARSVVTRAAAALSAEDQARLAVRDLPESALAWQARS